MKPFAIIDYLTNRISYLNEIEKVQINYCTGPLKANKGRDKYQQLVKVFSARKDELHKVLTLLQESI